MILSDGIDFLFRFSAQIAFVYDKKNKFQFSIQATMAFAVIIRVAGLRNIQ